MPRNTKLLSPGRPSPFEGDRRLALDDDTCHGPLPFFNSTQARFRIQREDGTPYDYGTEESRILGRRAALHWRARDNRKGRHVLLINSRDSSPPAAATATLTASLKGIARMFTECPYWDISYLVAIFFATGCLAFIACGLFFWLPLVAPGSEFHGESTIAGGITAFIGGTLFEIGAVLLVLEACNENQSGCFGWAVHELFANHEGSNGDANRPRLLMLESPNDCKHHHQRGRKGEPLLQPQSHRKWKWWPSWNEIKRHYIHEMGFVASASLAVGATVFYISAICSLPGIYENMSLGLARGLYWLTYLLGGVFFIFSSILYMVETQPNWYTPAPWLLGWHVGFWNLVGSVGWTLAASFGYCTGSGCQYESNLTLIWASTAFLIGSLTQWYEALNKYPVERDKFG